MEVEDKVGIAKLQQKVDNLNDSFDRMDSKINNLDENLNKLVLALTDNVRDSKESRGRIEKIELTIDNLSDNINKLVLGLSKTSTQSDLSREQILEIRAILEKLANKSDKADNDLLEKIHETNSKIWKLALLISSVTSGGVAGILKIFT